MPVLLAGLILLLSSCHNTPGKQDDAESENKQQLKEALIEANRSAVAAEKDMILNYADRHQWKLNKASGIYYVRYHKGEGESIEMGDLVYYHYTLSLINGRKIATSKNGSPQRIRVGAGGTEVSGLHRAMPYLKRGDKAKVIVPSHLAYGLAGNQSDIPSKATLIYDLHILEVSNQSD